MVGKKVNQGNKRERESNTPSPENPSIQPSKKKVNMGEKSLDDLFLAIKDMDNRLNGRIESMEKDLRCSVKTLSDTLEIKFQKWEEEKAVLVCKQRDLEKRVDDLERRERKNCAIITGLEVTRADVKVVVNNTLAKLDQPVTVAEANVFNVQGGATKVFVRFHSFDDKLSVFKQKIKMTGPGGSGQVYINDDLTRGEREMQFYGRSLAKTLRAQNKTVRMGYGKMCVDGEWRVWDKDTKTFVSRKN